METLQSPINPRNSYESLDGAQFLEVSPDDSDFGKALEIQATTETPETEVEQEIKRKLIESCWWLSDYWREKGLPKEQITIQVGENTIEVYNFGAQLDQRQIDELQKAVSNMTKVKNGELLGQLKYILIDNLPNKNPFTGEEMNGYFSTVSAGLTIYPIGTDLKPHRIPAASNFEGTIIHEWSHALGADEKFRNEWIAKFGWEEKREFHQLPGGAPSNWIIANPEKCLNDYARINPREDISESMVAALISPESLDPERLAYIQENLLTSKDFPEISLQKKKGEEVELPRIEQPVKYRRVEPVLVKIVDNEK